jgi:hypothetical protein
MRRYFAFITAALFLALQGCNVTVSSGGQRYEGAGITFVVPLQTSDVTNGSFGIDYKSTYLTARTDGSSLLVNGKAYGRLKSGDIIDFTQAGIVKVNGSAREPLPSGT